MDDTLFTAQQALIGLGILHAIPVVALALWGNYLESAVDTEIKSDPLYARQNASKKSEDERTPWDEESLRIRLAGAIVLGTQLLLFVSTTPLRQLVPAAGNGFLVLSVLIQLMQQSRLEDRIYKRLVKPVDGIPQTLQGAGVALRLVLYSMVSGFIYLASLVGTLVTAGLISTLLNGGPVVRLVLLLMGGAGGILLGILGSFALSPWLLRKLLPTSEAFPPELKTLVDETYRRCGLRPAQLRVLEFGPTGPASATHTQLAMTAGFSHGKSIFRPSLFISRELLEKLDSESQAAVIAHEVSHHALNHLNKRIWLAYSSVLTGTFLAGVLLVAGRLLLGGAQPSTGSALLSLMSVGALFITLFLTVHKMAAQNLAQELEADAFAIQKLGAQPQALVKTLQSFLKISDVISRDRLVVRLKHLETLSVQAAQAQAPIAVEKSKAA